VLSVQPGTLELAKYPFLQEAGDLMRSIGINIDDLGKQENWKIVQRARERVVQAVHKTRVSSDLEDLDSEILSFPAAIVLVRATNHEYLMQRYALAEALRIEELLEHEKPAVVTFIFRKVLNIRLTEASERVGGKDYQFKIHITDYLKRASAFHKPEWKLVNRVLQKGYVLLRPHDLIRLIREEIRQIIFQRMRSLQAPQLPQSLQQVVAELKVIAPRPKGADIDFHVSPEKYPPCVRMALSMLEKGQSVPHYGNFLLATYLLKVGKTAEEVVGVFTKSPDYKESIARYQVEHIAGLKGGRTRYSVPSCRTLQAHNFCWKDPIGCAGIVSPIQYGRQKWNEGDTEKTKWKRVNQDQKRRQKGREVGLKRTASSAPTTMTDTKYQHGTN
jgi:DNA primase large subunit